MIVILTRTLQGLLRDQWARDRRRRSRGRNRSRNDGRRDGGWRLRCGSIGYQSTIDLRRGGGGQPRRSQPAGNGRRSTWVLEAVLVLRAWESGTLRRTQERLDGTVAWRHVGLVRVGLRLSWSHLVPYSIVARLLCIVFVEGHDIDGGLRVLFLLLLGDSILLQHALPFSRQTLSCAELG